MTVNTIPDDRSYTEEHEWVLIAPGAALPDTPPVSGTITAVEVRPTATGPLLTAAEYAEKNGVTP